MINTHSLCVGMRFTFLYSYQQYMSVSLHQSLTFILFSQVLFPREDQKPVEKMMELFVRLKEILNQMASGTHPLLEKMRSLNQMHLPRSVPLTQVEKSPTMLFRENPFIRCLLIIVIIHSATDLEKNYLLKKSSTLATFLGGDTKLGKVYLSAFILEICI